MPRLLFLLLLVCQGVLVHAQEVLCRVQVQAPSVQGIDPSVLRQLQNDITNYINNRRWTADRYEVVEKIQCSLNMVITYGAQQGDGFRFEGTCQVQGTRPVYGSNYETVTLNFNDRDFKFTYNPANPLVASEQQYQSNLLSMLDFYVLLVVGMDYDSFGLQGGTPYFQRAQNVLNVAQTGREPGWAAFDGNRTRYWLIENLLNSSYRNLRGIHYHYHRQGLDQLGTAADKARAAILEDVELLRQLWQGNPDLFLVRVFLDTKLQEMTNLYMNGTAEQKRRFVAAMAAIDPSNASVYEQVNRGKN